MHFYYIDAQAELHTAPIRSSLPQAYVDIDMHWLTLGHAVFPHRLHGMACFERIVSAIPDDHQFSFRSWYDMQRRMTHCMWYSIPKILLEGLPQQGLVAKSLIFMLPSYFPPAYRNKNVLVFVDVPCCEMVVGYVRGHCVFFKNLPNHVAVNAQHEWLHVQQAYPQWSFEHSVYLCSRATVENTLVQTHQTVIMLDAFSQPLKNRIMLYGLN